MTIGKETHLQETRGKSRRPHGDESPELRKGYGKSRPQFDRLSHCAERRSHLQTQGLLQCQTHPLRNYRHSRRSLILGMIGEPCFHQGKKRLHSWGSRKEEAQQFSVSSLISILIDNLPYIVIDIQSTWKMRILSVPISSNWSNIVNNGRSLFNSISSRVGGLNA